MRNVYTKKADPQARVTWMDKFIALEPDGGVRAIVERIQFAGQSPDPASIYRRLTAPVHHRPATFAKKHERVRS